MILGIDFDGTVVLQDGRPYDDLETPLAFMPGAREALESLKRAGHVLVLFSARANRALRMDPSFDPLVRAGVRKVNTKAWLESQQLNEARYQQMVAFAENELSGVFDAIDDGMQGKPSVDLFIDDKALIYGGSVGMGWHEIDELLGEPPFEEEPDDEEEGG